MIYQDVSGLINAVKMTVEDGRMLVDLATPLFEFSPPINNGRQWVVTPDGQDFLTINTQQTAAPTYCNMILNWPLLISE